MQINDNQESISYAGMVNNYLNTASDAFSNEIAIPYIKASYQKVGEAVSYSLHFISTNLGKRVSKAWYDPVSTDFVLQLCKPIELIASFNTSRKPIKGLYFLDRSLISLSQHLFVYIKEVNHLLFLPQALKRYFATFSFNRALKKPGVVLGKSWEWISSPIILAKHILFNLINKAFKVADLIFSFFTFKYKFKLFGYLKGIAKAASYKTHMAFVDIAHWVIERKEKGIRRQIVQNVGNSVTDYLVTTTNRIFLKTVLGLGIYACLRPNLQRSIGLSGFASDTIALAVLSYSLWHNVCVPTLEPFFNTYCDEFDSESSNLQSFYDIHSLHYLYPPIRALQLYLGDD